MNNPFMTYGDFEKNLGKRFAKEVADKSLYKDCPEDIENSLQALADMNRMHLLFRTHLTQPQSQQGQATA